ncbi:MAG TPA: ADYC domain-containing protein [Myxococcaceae bacterium]|nr:ADYC domain-containing protein [Myxococcaceae bacterium]
MGTMTKRWIGVVCALASAAALAGGSSGAPAAADKYARRCGRQGSSRFFAQQGPQLWGTWSGWREKDRVKPDEKKSVVVSANLDGLAVAPDGVKALALEGGHLSSGAKGAVLRGLSSDGQPVEVAVCEEEPAEGDPQMTWYQIQAWNPVSLEWENPCIPTGDHPSPRALALGGVWDPSGAHHEVAGKITFACENGDLTKCVGWGYKPWEKRDGRSMADAHQACTRMARADYCGDGQSHTKERTTIEYYDSLGLNARMTRAVPGWDPERASFEAAWAPDGASCLARTRHGEPMEAVLKECPGRFKQGEADLGGGDRCAVKRADPDALAGALRNRVNGNGAGAR